MTGTYEKVIPNLPYILAYELVPQGAGEAVAFVSSAFAGSVLASQPARASAAPARSGRRMPDVLIAA